MSTESVVAQRIRSSATPALFAKAVTQGWKRPFKIWRHIAMIDQAIIDTIQGRSEPILIVELPPRHGKSELISKYNPAWYLGTFPDHRVILAGHTDSLARQFGRASRNLLNEFGPDYFGVRVSPDSAAAHDWKVSGHEGGMLTAGIGGPLTGRGANLLIIDDYIKNAEEARSQSILDGHWDWWNSTASTRLEPNGVVIIVATRWVKNDLSGRILDQAAKGGGTPVRRLRLPALAESDDPLGRAPGEALWPQRFDREQLERMREDKGYYFQALYQQNPSQHEGIEWPAEYFDDAVIWADGPNANGGWPARNEFHQSAMAMDPAEGKSKGDYTATLAGGSRNGLLFVDSIIERAPIEIAVSKAIDTYLEWRPSILACEINMHRSLLAREFGWQSQERKIIPPRLRLINTTTNKENRIRTLGSLFAQKKIRFRDTKSNRLLVQQLREFPLSQHDDGPDALEMLVDTFHWLHSDDAAGDRHTVENAYAGV